MHETLRRIETITHLSTNRAQRNIISPAPEGNLYFKGPLFVCWRRMAATTVQDRCRVLVYQCLYSLAPSYSQLVSDVRPRRLRSSDSVTCAVRRTRTTYGDRCFAVAGPRVWNSLPTELHVRQCDSLGQFKRRLKTHLFGLWDHSA